MTDGQGGKREAGFSEVRAEEHRHAVDGTVHADFEVVGHVAESVGVGKSRRILGN